MPPPPDEILGVIPAAGNATRMGKLPCSKELLPIGLHAGGAVQVLTDLLLAHFEQCGARSTVLAVAPHKQDIITYYGAHSSAGMPLSYVQLRSPSTVHSIDACYAQAHNKIVLLGFPDIVLPQGTCCQPLLQRLHDSKADLVLGLFPTTQPSRVDMVKVDGRGHVRDILIKQPSYPPAFQLTWAVAAWRPTFTTYLHQQLPTLSAKAGELYVGDVITAALKDGLTVHGIQLADAPSVDTGTPESYASVLAARLADN